MAKLLVFGCKEKVSKKAGLNTELSLFLAAFAKISLAERQCDMTAYLKSTMIICNMKLKGVYKNNLSLLTLCGLDSVCCK